MFQMLLHRGELKNGGSITWRWYKCYKRSSMTRGQGSGNYICMYTTVLSSARSCRSCICPGRLFTAWLDFLVIFSCNMVSKWWHSRSICRLWGGWCALPGTISFFSHCWLYLTFVLSLTQMLVVLSLHVMLSIILSILVCAAASLFCACLVSVKCSRRWISFKRH